MATKTDTTRRTYHRKETVRFEVSFYQDESKLQPLTPLDTTKYPSYTIFDKSNNIVTYGIGIFIQSGDYYSLWNIPEDAELASDMNKYRIEWLLIDDTKRQFNFVQEFNVVDEDVLSEETNQQEYHTLINKPIRIRYKTRVIPYELKMTLFAGSNELNPIYENVSYTKGKLTRVEDDTWNIFYYDIPQGVLNIPCQYTVIWALQEYEQSDIVYDYQIINAIPASLLRMIKEVRMMIDKLQKKLNTSQAYQDSDVIEYLNKGLELVNGWFPVTYYDALSMPKVLDVFWVLAASWYGLNAQHLLNVELQYNFGGQIDSFDFDHASGIEAFLGRVMDFMNQNLTRTKEQIFRTSHRVGSVGVRPTSMRRGWGNNIVFRLSNGGTFSPAGGNYFLYFGLS